MKELLNHHWKGEVRELENIIERAVIFAEGKLITRNELPHLFAHQPSLFSFREDKTLKEAVAEFERAYIAHVLRRHPAKEELARVLNISLSSLYRKIEELNIEKEKK
jgi:two-component system response regulator PilR (NtrC family)